MDLSAMLCPFSQTPVISRATLASTSSSSAPSKSPEVPERAPHPPPPTQDEEESGASGVRFVRRRRKRTSPQDQAILEQEYRKCDRPDKAQRLEIAKRVNMGEKEVQIWFCNKRQALRRRATPLLPHEMVPRKPGTTLPPTSYCFRKPYFGPGTEGPRTIPTLSPPAPSRSKSFSESSSPPPDSQNNNSTSQPPQLPASPRSSPRGSSPTPDPRTRCSSQDSDLASAAHRRLQRAMETDHGAMAPPTLNMTSIPSRMPSRMLKRTPSIRLSAIDGKAAVIVDDCSDEPILPPISRRSSSSSRIRPFRRSLTDLGPIDTSLFEFCADNQSALHASSSSSARIYPNEAGHALRLVRTKSVSSAWELERSASKNGIFPASLRKSASDGDESHKQTGVELMKTASASLDSLAAMTEKEPAEKRILATPARSRKKPTSIPSSSRPRDAGKDFTIYEPNPASKTPRHPVPGAPASPPPTVHKLHSSSSIETSAPSNFKTPLKRLSSSSTNAITKHTPKSITNSAKRRKISMPALMDSAPPSSAVKSVKVAVSFGSDFEDDVDGDDERDDGEVSVVEPPPAGDASAANENTPSAPSSWETAQDSSFWSTQDSATAEHTNPAKPAHPGKTVEAEPAEPEAAVKRTGLKRDVVGAVKEAMERLGSPRRRAELECVENLLSLKGAGWR